MQPGYRLYIFVFDANKNQGRGCNRSASPTLRCSAVDLNSELRAVGRRRYGGYRGWCSSWIHQVWRNSTLTAGGIPLVVVWCDVILRGELRCRLVCFSIYCCLSTSIPTTKTCWISRCSHPLALADIQSDFSQSQFCYRLYRSCHSKEKLSIWIEYFEVVLPLYH